MTECVSRQGAASLRPPYNPLINVSNSNPVLVDE